MTDNEILIEIAKLDDWEMVVHQNGGQSHHWEKGDIKQWLPTTPYLTSRDAIIPVIEKHVNPYKPNGEWGKFFTALDKQQDFDDSSYIFATPRQLCIALLKAVGKYKE